LNFFFPNASLGIFLQAKRYERGTKPEEKSLSLPRAQGTALPPGPILPTPHPADPSVGAEGAAAVWDPQAKPIRTAAAFTVQPWARRQCPDTGRDRPLARPFHLKSLKLSSVQAGSSDELSCTEKRYGTSSCTLHKTLIKEKKKQRKKKQAMSILKREICSLLFPLLS